MIIKGLFRRYERWNPVHPTYGAFWGMGIGIGCGVGWGPGFGPDVIGYVGAGCGVGFSVGFTWAGVGIGLPVNSLFQVPYNAFMVTRSAASEFARSSGRQISILQREANERLPNFKASLDKGVDLSEVKDIIFSPISDQLGKINDCFFHPRKGSKD